MIKYLKNFFNIIITFLILVICLWVIWNRFFQIKIPRNIPHEFSFCFYFIISITCYFNLINFIYLLQKKEKKSLLAFFLEYIIKSLKAFDQKVKSLSFYNKFFIKHFIKIFNWFKTKKHLYFKFYLLPKIVLIFIFFIETFYFNYINYFYKLLWLGALPLMYTYILYTFQDSLIKESLRTDSKVEIVYIHPEGPRQFAKSLDFINHLIRSEKISTLTVNLFEIMV